ncbi:uncharacterized protein LOC133335697, partial [Musca vetustissima]|uniref:uncharacterized protein LOC133335697 n=1 Tax=Musca vetustissima TaxID=27455 RepID=UPI002AB7B183
MERNFDMKSITVHTSRPDLFSLSDWKVERVSRGVFAFSGIYTLNVTVNAGDSNQIEVLTYRSDNGVRDFRLLPFIVERQHTYDFMNGFYKFYVMNSIKSCSTMPVFKGRFNPPMEKRSYVLDKCQVNLDDFPQ